MTKPLTTIEEKLTQARQAIKWAIIVVISLVIIWFTIAILSGSVGLLAKGLDSFTDLIALITVFIGLWLAQKAPSGKYPYGYFKAETLAALIVSIFIFITGLGVLWEAIQRIFFPTVLTNLTLAIIISIASIPVNIIISWYLKKIGRDTESDAVLNSGQEFQLDILATIAVIIGLIVAFFGLPWVELIVGFVIGLIILRTSFQMAYESILILMDAGQDPEKISKIAQLVEPIIGVLGVHDIRLRRAGPICFGEMHLEVAGKMSVLESHRLTEEIEERVKETFSEVLTFLVHVEPVIPVTFRVAFPVDSGEATPDSKPSLHFGSVGQFLIMDIKHEEISLWEILPNPASKQEKRRGKDTATLLIDAKVEIAFAEKMGETPLSILRNHLIRVYQQESTSSCRRNLEKFFADELAYITPKEREEPHQ
ncbi:MAG: cation diffusion facilitator family transporter [Promethearchaeota archaeon]